MRYKMVSLIMPVYNAGKYIEEAINSILNQTYTNFELILIDDVSTDNTWSKVSKYNDSRIKTIHNDKNRGIAYSRNRGIEVARGEYIALMDDDDISTPDRFEKQVNYLDEHLEYDFIGGRYQTIDEKGNVISENRVAYYNPNFIKAMFLFQNVYCNGEMMFRKSVIDKYHIRYEDGQYGMEDYRFWIECSKVGKFTTLDKVFLQHRIHDQSETNRNILLCDEVREQHRKKLQKYSLELSGIYLEKDELDIMHKYTKKEKCLCLDELEKYRLVLKKIFNQAKRNKAEYIEELDILEKKYFVAQIRHVKDFWK